MFRRRPARLRRLLRRRHKLPRRIRRMLAGANILMEEGQFAEAARVFGDLTDGAEELGLPVRAAELSLLTARAHFAAGDVDAAMGRASQALHLLARGGRAGRIPRVLPPLVGALREKGFDTRADRLEQEAAQLVGGVEISLEATPQQYLRQDEARGALPARCDGCGAPLIPDEVEWHDLHTAECPYCGTVVKTA